MQRAAASPVETSSSFLGFLPLRDFFYLDLRSLALLRVGLGFMLILDWLDRLPDLHAHYSDTGIVPRNIITGLHPVSIHMFSGETWFQAVLAIIALVFAALLFVGWRTPFVTLISWFLLISVHSRDPAVMQGGDHLIRMVLFWSIFLPLGARYSVDSAGEAYPQSYRVLTPASVAYIIQLCIVYWYAASWKWAPEWRTDGTSVYLALKTDYFATRIAHFLLGYPDVLRILTFMSLWLEVLGPLVLFFPFAPSLQRLLVIFAFITFHIGLSLSLELSTFPWVCCVAWLALLPSSFWDRIGAQTRRSGIAKTTIWYDGARRSTALACLRTFLALEEVRLAPAQEMASVLRQIRWEGGWGAVDAEGNLHCGVDALAFLVKLSPLTFPLARLFRWSSVRWLGERFSRLLVGRVKREKNSEVVTPTWTPPGGIISNTVVIFCLVYVVLFNIRSFTKGKARSNALTVFTLTNRSANALLASGVPKEVVQKLAPLKDQRLPSAEELVDRVQQLLSAKQLEQYKNQIVEQAKSIEVPRDNFEWLFPDEAAHFGEVMGLEQGWALFAPRPGIEVGWHIIVGKLKDGREVDVLTGGPVDWTKPELQAATYPNGRWRKMMMNLAPQPNMYPYLPPGMAVYYFRAWNAAHDGSQQLHSVEIHWMKEETRPYGVTPPPVQNVTLITYEFDGEDK